MKVGADITVAADRQTLAAKGAELFFQAALTAVQERGRFSVAVSGGSTPRRLHRKLADEYYAGAIPWSKGHIFWVDERCVAVDDPTSNYGSAKRDWLDKIVIPTERLHPMPARLPAEEGAALYERELREFFQMHANQFPVFDLILLGIGADGHTASLFPRQAALLEKRKWVAASTGGSPNVPRITLTLPVINNARKVVFIVAGKDKAGMVRRLLENGDTGLPAQRVRPINGRVRWLLDREAASLLANPGYFYHQVA